MTNSLEIILSFVRALFPCTKFIDMETEVNSKLGSSSESPVCLIILGMAGSGKTTFVKKLTDKLYSSETSYVVNLDPACIEVPYPCNVGKYFFFLIEFLFGSL